MLCTQDCWKSKGIPFLWLTQLKSSCHSNMRSQLSWFCFILNKLFLLRKMVFLPGSELTTNVWPLCLQRRGYLLLLLNVWSDSCGSWARSRENRHVRVDQPVVPNLKKSSWLSCCGTPFVCSEKGGHLLLYSSPWRGSGADAGMQEAGKHHPASQNGVQVWGFAGLKSWSSWILSFWFILFTQHVWLWFWLFFFLILKKKFEIALNLARKPLHQIAKRKSEMSP